MPSVRPHGHSEHPAATDPDAVRHARDAGLRYATDASPGYRCRRRGARLSVFDTRGRRVTTPAVLGRIRALVLPPAWRDVWVAADPRAHLQATGRDAAGRKQYRYHPAWTAIRDATKYHLMLAFARALPAIRRRVARDRREPPLSRAAVLATVVALLERTHIRVGNETYAQEHGSHGLTTLRDRHVHVRGSRMRFAFKGKSGVRQTVEIEDARLARAVRRCQELPGQQLFQYRDAAGVVRSISSSDVNAYLAEATGENFTAKDFRTWAGTLAAARALDELGPARSAAAIARSIVRAADIVAAELGNTRAVCRRCYIHPAVLSAYEGGLTLGRMAPRRPMRGLHAAEASLLRLLGAGRDTTPTPRRRRATGRPARARHHIPAARRRGAGRLRSE